jgi:uncharacterized membrane protein YkvA (DUF1232 family)
VGAVAVYGPRWNSSTRVYRRDLGHSVWRPMDEDRAPSPVPPPPPEKHAAARLGETLTRLPSYLRLARRLLGDRRLGRFRKLGLGAGVAYLASPIDLIPGVVPVLGQLDDLAAILLAIRFALRGLPGPAADALLANVGLSRELLWRDLDNVRAASVWAAKGTGRIGARAAGMGAAVAAGVARLGFRAARAGVRSGVRAARRGQARPH